MKGELILIDNIKYSTEEFQIPMTEKLFSLKVYINIADTLEAQLKNKPTFNYCMKVLDSVWNKYSFITSIEQIKSKRFIQEHFDILLDYVEYIKLDFESRNNLQFIKSNPIVLTKKIILNEKLNIDDCDYFMRLMDDYKEIADKIYVTLEGNENYISLLECEKIINTKKGKVNKMKTEKEFDNNDVNSNSYEEIEKAINKLDSKTYKLKLP